MPIDDKIASRLFRAYPEIVERGQGKLPLHEGDLVADRGLAGLPRIPDDSIGRIRSITASMAKVEWRDGTTEKVKLSALVRVSEPYEPAIHQAAFELSAYTPGTRVLLGNGNTGRVIEELVGPTGFKSFRIEIDGSRNTNQVGSRVYATANGMAKISSLSPDVAVSFYGADRENPKATIGAELAVGDAQIMGLQKYSSLPTDYGMVFPYDPPRWVTFHMGSVSFPIDIMFIDPQGRVAHIVDNAEPGTPERWSYGRVSGVVEVNGGWCVQNGVVPGDLVRLSTAKSAQMEFDPSRPDNETRGLTDIRPDAPDRFKDRQMPADILDGEADPAHFDQQIGYDPTHFSEDGPGMRPAANKRGK